MYIVSGIRQGGNVNENGNWTPELARSRLNQYCQAVKVPCEIVITEKPEEPESKKKMVSGMCFSIKLVKIDLGRHRLSCVSYILDPGVLKNLSSVISFCVHSSQIDVPSRPQPESSDQRS